MTSNTGQAQHTIRRVLDAKRRLPGALLPILHAIQDEQGMCRPRPWPTLPRRMA